MERRSHNTGTDGGGVEVNQLMTTPVELLPGLSSADPPRGSSSRASKALSQGGYHPPFENRNSFDLKSRSVLFAFLPRSVDFVKQIPYRNRGHLAKCLV